MDSYGIGSYRATWRHPFMASAGSCVSSANQGAHLLELSFETWVITNIAGRWEWAYESRDSTYHFQRVSIVEASLHSFFSASAQPSWPFVPNHHGKCSEIATVYAPFGYRPRNPVTITFLFSCVKWPGIMKRGAYHLQSRHEPNHSWDSGPVPPGIHVLIVLQLQWI